MPGLHYWIFYHAATGTMRLAALAINTLLLGWIAYQVSKTSKGLINLYWPALAVKLIGGIAIGLVYGLYYQTGDTLIYFRDASELSALYRHDATAYFRFLWDENSNPAQLSNLTFQVPRALFLVKIASVFSILSYDNYWVSAAYFSLFSFLGSWFLVRKISLFFPQFTGAAAVAFLFFPSVVFWSSGLIKESLAMAAVFYLSGIFLNLWYQKKIKILDWILVILSTWIVWQLKYYFAAVFFAVSVNSLFYKSLLNRIIKPKSFRSEIVIWMITFIVPFMIATQVHPNFYPERLLEVLVENYKAFYAVSAPEDLIHFRSLEPTLWSVLLNAPWALVSGLFRPFLWEAGTLFQFLVSIENLLLLAGTAASLYSVKRIIKAPERMLIFSCFVYILWLCVFITLSTPNFGTLSRYRVGYIPYFAFLIFCSPGIATILQRSFNRLAPDKT